MTRSSSFIHLCFVFVMAITLAACGGDERTSRFTNYPDGDNPYPPPGPKSDPWGPYIQEASTRFNIPNKWIRAVIHQESGGYEYMNGSPITSSAGAMGLMQLMQPTYDDMKDQNNLGDDPFEPHDNIMAGTAYVRFLYRKYGAPGFLAAYNAGPQRLENYIYKNRPLPNETVNYIASITPNLGNELPLSGPLASYAGPDQMVVASTPSGAPLGGTTQLASTTASTTVTLPTQRQNQGQCYHNPDEAYDPDAPCETPPPQQTTPPLQLAAYHGGSSYAKGQNCYRGPDHDEDDDDAPCLPPPINITPLSQQSVSATPLGTRYTPRSTPSSYHARPIARPLRPAPHYTTSVTPSAKGQWGIQVGAFISPQLAQSATRHAQQLAYAPLSQAGQTVQKAPTPGKSLYRARLTGLSRSNASSACTMLQHHGQPCMIVRPGD